MARSKKAKPQPNDNKKKRELQEFIDKIQGLKKENKLDLSSDQDLSVALMNLISIEEHLFFSGAKTSSQKYYDLLQEVRAVRKELLRKLIGDGEDGSERWCISKHLLGATMRLMEVGTKQLNFGKKQEAFDFFEKAYDLYSLFWGMNLNIIDVKGIKKIDEHALHTKDGDKNSLRSKLGAVVRKAIDCCLE